MPRLASSSRAVVALVLASPAVCSSAFARPAFDGPVAHAAWVQSDNTGRDCSKQHAVEVSLDVGGQHWGKGRKYINLQIVGKAFDEERSFYAKAFNRKTFVVCKVVRVTFDRYDRYGDFVGAVYRNYYPRRPGLSVNGTVPPQSNRRVTLIAYGRFKAKHK